MLFIMHSVTHPIEYAYVIQLSNTYLIVLPTPQQYNKAINTAVDYDHKLSQLKQLPYKAR